MTTHNLAYKNRNGAVTGKYYPSPINPHGNDGHPFLPVKITIAVPLYNEMDVIPNLLGRINAITANLCDVKWDLVLINDGSTDDTVEKLHQHRDLFQGPIKLISFSRNFGHQRALLAGITYAKGDAIICLDADLQDPPEMIPQFLKKFREGYDVVYAVRKTRSESFPKRFAYALFYRVFQRIAETPIPLDAGDFGLMSQRVVAVIKAAPERDIFLRGLRGWIGFKQIGLPYDRPCRHAGETKYSLSKLCSLAASAFFGFSFLPLRIATTLGFATVSFTIIYALHSIYVRIVKPGVPGGWASMTCLLSLLGGVQLISTGILGEYIGRIYKQSQARPHFIIADEKDI